MTKLNKEQKWNLLILGAIAFIGLWMGGFVPLGVSVNYDADGDNLITPHDYYVCSISLGKYDIPECDFNGNGAIDTEDLEMLENKMYSSLNIPLLFGEEIPCEKRDIDENGIIELIDLSLLGQAWQTVPGDENWNPRADLDDNGVVDLIDVALLGKEWGTVCSEVPSPTTTLPVEEFCIDNDNGQNEFIRASSWDAHVGSANDFCLDANRVLEYYCRAKSRETIPITCQYGCYNGACRSSPVTTTTTTSYTTTTLPTTSTSYTTTSTSTTAPPTTIPPTTTTTQPSACKGNEIDLMGNCVPWMFLVAGIIILSGGLFWKYKK